VDITGLNGVGCITKHDKYITTFDQKAALAEIKTIHEHEKAIRDKNENEHTEKNLLQADYRLRKHIAARSCHFITYNLNFATLVTEGDVFSKFFKKQRAARQTAPGKLSGGGRVARIIVGASLNAVPFYVRQGYAPVEGIDWRPSGDSDEPSIPGLKMIREFR
jgi:hypothetical protein